MSALASCAKTVFLQRDRIKSHSSITFTTQAQHSQSKLWQIAPAIGRSIAFENRFFLQNHSATSQNRIGLDSLHLISLRTDTKNKQDYFFTRTPTSNETRPENQKITLLQVYLFNGYDSIQPTVNSQKRDVS